MPRQRFYARIALVTLGLSVVLGTDSAQAAPPPWTTRQAFPLQLDEPPGSLMVLLSRRSGELHVRVDGPYQIHSGSDPQNILAQGDKLADSVLEFADNGLRLGDSIFHSGDLIVRAVNSGTLWVGDRRYRGNLRLRVASIEKRQLQAFNEVDLEEYLASVISCEMPASFPDEARKAQLIAARGYVLFHMQSVGYVYDDSRSQNYRGMEYHDAKGRHLAAETEDSRRLVEQTRGKVLVIDKCLFCTFYSAVCGGHTASGASVFGKMSPPLSGRESNFCQGAPNYRWQRYINIDQVLAWINADLAASETPWNRLSTVTTAETGAGQVPRIHFEAGERQRVLSGVELRNRFAPELPSHFFSVTLDGDQLVFNGRGWGHGVGLCQWGSKTLAEQGKTAEGILAHYYPGSKLVQIAAP